jgi:aminoglycoside phosphotransferase (APT) family kinase protein
VVLAAAARFGFAPSDLRPLPGGSNTTWAVGDYVLRVGPRERLRLEVAASVSASAVLPTPRVLATVDLEVISAALLERRAGVPAGQVDGLTIGEARQRGAECAAVHDRLATIAAPSLLPDAEFPCERGRPRRRLLHLDLHPFNVLIDTAGRISAVIDWANSAAGDPQLDRARTLSILTLDPSAMQRRAEPRYAAFADAWIEAGQLRDTDAAARAWACRYLLVDLAKRHSPGELAHIHRALARIRQA